jgi:hypothetical protein
MTPEPTATATLLPTPIPVKVVLGGIVHEYQQFNNCGPANLAMALSYWGWQGDQRDTRAFAPNREGMTKCRPPNGGLSSNLPG